MITWNIKTNKAFQKEWNEFKEDYSTEGYDLKYVFEIYLPFWQCKQNIVVEKDLELDRFSKILLEFISYKRPSHADICQFLGIEEYHFSIIMQLNFLEKENLIRSIEPDNYEITHEGIEFLSNKKRPRTMETEEFDYMAKEKYSFLENDMTNDFFDPSRPIDKQLSPGKKNDFSGYEILQTHQHKKEIQDKVYIRHNNNPTYRKVEAKRNDFSEFYNAMNPEKIFYDFADNAFESHKRSICFLGFWYENREKSDDIIVDIRQFKKSVKEFKENELERELSKKVTEYVLKNNVKIGVPLLSTENNNIHDKFIKAAEQSEIDSEGYILMNEFAPTCKSLGIEWEEKFKIFLESHKDIIEFKPNTPHNAPAIRIKSKTSEKTIFMEQKLKEADKIYIDTCSLMETPIEKFLEKTNPILRKYNKKIIVLSTVGRELKKIASDGGRKYDLERQGKAKTALNVLNPFVNEIEPSNEEDDNEKIADQVFKIIFERYRNKYKMLLISQDSTLSSEILNMNNSEAVRGEKCVVCRINDEGYLCDVANI